MYLDGNTPELLRKEEICTLNNSNYVMVELPMSHIPEYTKVILYNICLLGYTPIIAHPERNNEIMNNLDALKSICDTGVLTQINSGSITQIYGRKVRNTAKKILKLGIASFVASDAHSIRTRAPRIIKASKICNKICGCQKTKDLIISNGLAVINNESINYF